jgi:hypothetical protein
VDKVRNHVEAIAIYVLLTGMVKMKLLQTIGLVADCECAARSVIDHDGVAVVNDAQRDALVIELQLRKVGEHRVPNVDWGLVMAHLARRERRVDLIPMFWTLLAFIAPMRRV